MADVRALLKAKRQEARITHPLASYSAAGQLRCAACGTAVKHASAWEGHVGSKAHRTNAARLRQEQARAAQREQEEREREEEVWAAGQEPPSRQRAWAGPGWSAWGPARLGREGDLLWWRRRERGTSEDGTRHARP